MVKSKSDRSKSKEKAKRRRRSLYHLSPAKICFYHQWFLQLHITTELYASRRYPKTLVVKTCSEKWPINRLNTNIAPPNLMLQVLDKNHRGDQRLAIIN